MMQLKYLLGIIALSLSVSSAYALENLNDNDLTEVTGQAGADLSIKMSLNHTAAAQFDTTLCADKRFCRLGLSLNNRYHDGTQDTVNATTGAITPSSTGRKQWLVFKGIQGTINIPELKLDGSTVSWGAVTQPTVIFGFTSTKPIEIRNLGFQALSIETDTCTEANTNCSTGSANTPGYLVPVASPSNYTGFDAGREKGFMGLNINTNLSITGSIKMFACGSNHPRC